jgi:hypothetical protein
MLASPLSQIESATRAIAPLHMAAMQPSRFT